LTANQFFDLLWCDYERLCYKQVIDQEYAWMRTREIIAMIYNVNRGKNSPVKTGRQLYPLSIDKKEVVEQLTKEDYEEITKKFKKYMPKKR
jgi:hypothetical protein